MCVSIQFPHIRVNTQLFNTRMNFCLKCIKHRTTWRFHLQATFRHCTFRFNFLYFKTGYQVPVSSIISLQYNIAREDECTANSKDIVRPTQRHNTSNNYIQKKKLEEYGWLRILWPNVHTAVTWKQSITDREQIYSVFYSKITVNFLHNYC
jgi:hypothetical protein